MHESHSEFGNFAAFCVESCNTYAWLLVACSYMCDNFKRTVVINLIHQETKKIRILPNVVGTMLCDSRHMLIK